MNLDMLVMNIIKGKAPCIVGLDVGKEDLPHEFAGENAAASVRAFNRAVIDAVSELVPAIAVNVPALLPYGIDTVADAISYAKEKGMFTVADAKCCGDPVSSQAEAEFYFNKLGADCVTVSPYFGAAGLSPFFEKCAEESKSVFVLARSERGTPQDFQELMAGLRTVYRAVCEKVALWGDKRTGDMGYSDIGVMLGGVENRTLAELRRVYKKTLLLLTGYDGKKVSAHDLNGAFDMRGLGGLVYVTRAITLPSGDGALSEKVKAAAETVCRDLRLCF
ncbi:MAG: orotidine-5'-phosphate decarboxylase [Oscillospiraceae bacterium]|nr:orotidine-5'-phosphate decarboxylase [Oscillospiraceae bacterium]